MDPKKRVLATGASGLIGRLLRDGLKGAYRLKGLDVQPTDDPSCTEADMADLNAIRPAFEDIDVVVDLAAVPQMDIPWDVVRQNNLPATWNALEAARLAGVRRVIFASSNHVTGMYENDHPYSAIVAGRYQGLDPESIPRITTDMPIRPDGPYGIGKALGEAVGRYYSDRFGLSVLCIRIGTLNREGRPMDARQFATLLSHRDLVGLVTRCVEAPDQLGFGIFYGVSNNRWRFWDTGNSRSALGFEPRDDAEAWR